MSYKVEVIADSSGQWCGNGLRFSTFESADRYALNLAWRWSAVRETRVLESDDPITEVD